MEKPWHDQVAEFFENRVRKVGLFGFSVELNLNDSDLSLLTQNFVPALRNLLDKLNKKMDCF